MIPVLRLIRVSWLISGLRLIPVTWLISGLRLGWTGPSGLGKDRACLA